MPDEDPERLSPAAEAPDTAQVGVVEPALRSEMIAVAAYYLAERRGFAPGSELDDWLEAERAIERSRLAAG